jgi:hypothetical protein
MDPNATVRMLLEALQDGDREQLEEACSHLGIWLLRGGFMPDPITDFTPFQKAAH